MENVYYLSELWSLGKAGGAVLRDQRGLFDHTIKSRLPVDILNLFLKQI
jgi:hypothetical protein